MMEAEVSTSRPLALKMEGTVSLELQASPGSWRGSGDRVSPRTPRGAQPFGHFDFSPARSIPDF